MLEPGSGSQPPTPDTRNMAVGALAGAAGALGLMLAAVAVLGVGVLWQYAFSSSIPVIRDTALGAAIQDVSRMPSFLWGFRWLALGLTAGGAVLALLDGYARRTQLLWRDRIVPAAVLALACTATVAGLLLTTDSFLFSGSDRSESLPSLAERSVSVWSVVGLGAAAGLAAGGAGWLYWSWWYEHLRRWMRLPAAPSPRTGDLPADAWFARRQAQQRAARLALALLAGAAALTFVAVGVFEGTRTRVASGDLWVKRGEASEQATLRLDGAERRLVVENTAGAGRVALTLYDERGAPATPPGELAFLGRGVGSDRVELPVAELPVGTYALSGSVLEGEGGRAGYALLQRGGALAWGAALLVGLGAGATLGLASLALGMLALGRAEV